MDVAIAEEKDPKERRRVIAGLTARLPEWFGRPEANRHYAEQAEILEAWGARLDGQAVGLLLLKRHSAASAEIYWLGVDPQHHRRGIGRGLIRAVEDRLKQEAVRFLFVMTVHPEDPYEPYRRTRAFYEAIGFALALGVARSEPTANPLAYYLKLL
jgi:ribosomal protein S18 acetylase RimI-like enzyme